MIVGDDLYQSICRSDIYDLELNFVGSIYAYVPCKLQNYENRCDNFEEQMLQS